MKLRFLGGRYQGRIIGLKPESFSIGRGPDNDLILDEEGVSRRHCSLSEVDGTWFIEDHESTNGVRINGTRIDEKHALTPGDRIGIHQALLLFSDGSDIVDPEVLDGNIEKKLGTAQVDGDEPAAEAVAVEAQAVEDEEPEGGLPWGRVILLLGILILLAWLGYITFVPANRRNVVEAPDTTTTVTDIPEPDTDGVSDAELAKLMATDDTQDKPGPGLVIGGDAEPNEGVAAADGQPEQPAAGAPAAADVPDAPDENAGFGAAAPAPGAPTNIVLVESTPPGATVFIDNAKRGVTPLVARNLADGRHRVSLQMEGYEDLMRQIHVPDVLPTKPYELRQKPGTLLLRSTPAGASVWHGTQILGRTPCMISSLPEGEHKLGFAAAGHAPVRKKVTISSLRGESAEVVLASLLGAMEIITFPPGCRIYVDGTCKGITVEGDAKTRLSQPLRVEGLAEGEFSVKVEHPNGVARTGKIKVRRGETTPQTIKLWIIDTKAVLNNGTVKYGMLIEKNEFGDIVLADARAQYRYVRHLNPELAEVVTLTAEQAQAVLREFRGGRAEKPESKPGQKRPGADPRANVEPPVDDGENAAPEQQPDGKPAAADKIMHVTSAELITAFKHANATELNRRYQKRKMAVTGVATSSGRDGLGGYVTFGPRIRCFIGRDAFQRTKAKIKTALETKTNVTVTGTAVGISGNTLMIRDCEVKTAIKDE